MSPCTVRSATPFYTGLRADSFEGAADADRGDPVDIEDVIREFHDENVAIGEL
jgi:hypothetical protein